MFTDWILWINEQISGVIVVQKIIKLVLIIALFLIVCMSLTSCSSSDSKEVKRLKTELAETKKQLAEQTKNVPATSTLSKDMDKYISIGDKIIDPGTGETTIEKYEFAKIVKPSQPAGYYNYYQEKDTQSTYFHIIGMYKNLAEVDLDFDELPVEFKLIYKDRYEYDGFEVAEESGGNDFDILSYIAPLTSVKFHVLITVPKEVEISEDPLRLEVTSGSNKYIIKIR